MLPQSPQIAKQLLMVGGVDRYYQIARCLRDEDLRADRQFEFMQLDIEASFVDQDDVLGFVSEAVLDATEAVVGERPGAIPRLTWLEAMERFGSDKPDLRFGLELQELTFDDPEFRVLQAECVKGIRVPGRGHDEPVRARPADRPGQVPRGQGPALDAGDRGAHSTRRWPSSCPTPTRPCCARRSGPSPATCCSSWPTSARWCGPSSASCATTSAARR